MTLKEKVMQEIPCCVSDRFHAGVCGCPDGYDFLNGSLEDDEKDGYCPDAAIYRYTFSCEKCWNREYIEQEDSND